MGTLLFKHLSCVKFRHSISFILAQLKALNYLCLFSLLTETLLPALLKHEVAKNCLTNKYQLRRRLTPAAGRGGQPIGQACRAACGCHCPTTLAPSFATGALVQHMRFSDVLESPESMLNTYRLAYPTCAVYSIVRAPLCQAKFNHSGINSASRKMTTSVSNTDSKGHSAALHTVTLLFTTFMSCEWQRQRSQWPSALPLCPEFPPEQRGLASSPSKKLGQKDKMMTVHMYNDRKTPAANMAYLPVCLNSSKP